MHSTKLRRLNQLAHGTSHSREAATRRELYSSISKNCILSCSWNTVMKPHSFHQVCAQKQSRHFIWSQIWSFLIFPILGLQLFPPITNIFVNHVFQWWGTFFCEGPHGLVTTREPNIKYCYSCLGRAKPNNFACCVLLTGKCSPPLMYMDIEKRLKRQTCTEILQTAHKVCKF